MYKDLILPLLRVGSNIEKFRRIIREKVDQYEYDSGSDNFNAGCYYAYKEIQTELDKLLEYGDW